MNGTVGVSWQCFLLQQGCLHSPPTEAPHTRSLPIWVSYVLNKVQIFGWLLCLDRLNTRANLHHKTIDSASYHGCTSPIENTTPLFFTVSTAAATWDLLGLNLAFRLLPIFFKMLHCHTSLFGNQYGNSPLLPPYGGFGTHATGDCLQKKIWKQRSAKALDLNLNLFN
jgi:hypothetical protein